MANRCRVKEIDGEYKNGEFLGLLYARSGDDDAEVEAIVRLDGHGLFLAARHPSQVELLPESGHTAVQSPELIQGTAGAVLRDERPKEAC